MSIDVNSIIERARLATQKPIGQADAGGDERQRLARVAQEFESMLLTQVLRDMRKSGAWEDEDSGDTLGAATMYDTLDVELAGHLARVQGLGLSKQLMEAFDRMHVPGSSPQSPGPGPQGPGLKAVGPKAETAVGTVGRVLSDPAEVALGPQTAPRPEALGLGPTVSPVAGRVTSEFGWRSDPFTGKAKFHKGVDLKAAYGQDVRAAGEGRVVFSGQQGAYGTTVLLEHADGTRTRYAHLSVALVAQGDGVAAGQPVGQAGRSGRATGTHLHFEVIAPNGRPVNPRPAAVLALGADARSNGIPTE